MNKLILTTYRKLLKMCSQVDHDTAVRSMLSCAPVQVYNHSINEWVPLNVGKLSSWQDSRIFIDNLIRRLNNIRQFYVPPTLQAERDAAIRLHELRVAQRNARATISIESGFEQRQGIVSSNEIRKETTSSTSSTVHSSDSSSTPKGSETHKSSAVTTIPLAIKPYDPLCLTLRFFFESMPFSTNHLTNAFAAVKELSYACEVSKQIKHSLVDVPSELRGIDRPAIQRVLELQPMHHVHLMKGLTDEIRQSIMGRSGPYAQKLEVRRREARKRVGPATDQELGSPSDDNSDDATATSSSAIQSSQDTPTEDGVFNPAEPVLKHPVTSPSSHESESVIDHDAPGSNGVNQSDESDSLSSSISTLPKFVQLLLAHPQVGGFFRQSVLLVVRHASNESYAFVLNKPLENDEGTQVPVGATVRFSRIHAIFAKHLRWHTVMVGGPVMMGTFEDNMFLLHSVPGIPNAFPIADSLWLNGDLDVLMGKLDANQASPESVVVLCGFSGWGADQLRGEIDSGTWVAASGLPDDPRMSNMILSIVHHSSARASSEKNAESTSKQGDGRTNTVPEAKTLGSLGVGSPGRPLRARTKFQETESWVWVYDALGESLGALARNQKPESIEFPDHD